MMDTSSIARSVRLLVVDDNPGDTRQLLEWLGEATTPRLEIEVADRLSSAFKRLDKGGVDLVILDLFLPESKGLKTLHRLRKRAPSTTVIALTRFDDEDTGTAAVRDGAQDYLVKGEMDSKVLLRSIRHALERSSVEERLRESELKYRKMARELAEANADLKEFTYSVSHDLRAPLRGITGFSEILGERYRDQLDEKGQHYLDNIVQAGKQMGLLIDDLLAYTRLSRGALELKEVDLGEVFDNVASTLRMRIEETEAKINFPEELPVVLSNKTLLIQIFSNLITNAITFSRETIPPHVDISFEAGENAWSVAVRDNGIGIPNDNLEMIFNLFQRLHSQDDYPGTGIGLAIVKKSVAILGGSITVESTVGSGTAFTLTFPGKSPGTNNGR